MGIFKLHDVIALLKDIPEKKLSKGQVGTIVEQLDENIYEVEFCDKKDQTIALSEIEDRDMMELHFDPVIK